MHHIQSLAVLAALALAPLAGAAGIYSKGSGVLEINGKNFDKLIKNSDKASMVEFYAPWCGHCQKLKPAYEKAAKALEGLANIAAVNCDDDENKKFCGQMGIKGFPTLKSVRITGTPGKPIIRDYNEGRSASEIVEAVKGLIPNTVTRVEDKDLQGWLSEKNESAKAILFSDKGTTSALLKVLSNEYITNMPFAQIRKREKEAADMFGISKVPALVVLPGGNAAPVFYEGKMEKAPMNEFLSQYAELFTPPKKGSKKSAKEDKKAASSDSSTFSEASASHKSARASEAAASASTIVVDDPDFTSSPDPMVNADAPTPVPIPDMAPAIPTLDSQEQIQSNCLGPKTQTCVLALLPSSDANTEAELPESATAALASLAELAKKHKTRGGHLFPFYAIPATNPGSGALKSALGIESMEVELVAMNGRRGWWRRYSPEKGFGAMAVESWVDGIRFGEGVKEKLPEGLVVEEVETKVEAETEAEAETETETEAAEAETAPVDKHDEL